MATTWNPSDKSANFTLSESNLRATATGGGNIGVRATQAKTTGKYYWEIEAITHTDNTYDGFGVTKMSQSLAEVYQGTGGVELLKNGGIDVAGSHVIANYVGGGSGIRYRLAVDLDNQRFWGAVAGGVWNNDADANPTTNTGGVDISGVGSINGQSCAPCVMSSMATIDIRVNFGASAYTYSAPSGFGNWTDVIPPVELAGTANMPAVFQANLNDFYFSQRIITVVVS